MATLRLVLGFVPGTMLASMHFFRHPQKNCSEFLLIEIPKINSVAADTFPLTLNTEQRNNPILIMIPH